MSNLDLNIENYELKDLENFFRLNSPYNEQDVITKESEIRMLLLSSGHISPYFKRDLIIFLEEGKKRIIENTIIKKTPTTIYKQEPPIPHEYPLPNIPPLSRADNVIIQKPYKEYNVNPHKINTITRTLSIDTIFRENYEFTESTDFLLNLNEPINNVTSIKLASMELPNMWYLFSSQNKTNTFKINCFNIPPVTTNAPSTDEEYTITIPDGNYSSLEFETIINNIFINTGGGLKYIKFVIDSYSAKAYFRSAFSNEAPHDNPYQNNISFYFTLNFEISTKPISQTAGWIMGFRKLIYEANYNNTYTDIISSNNIDYHNYIISESLFDSNDTLYIFLELDDFQRNCVTDKVISTNKYYMANNILARITLNYGKKTVILDNGSDLIFKKREYFGPTKLEKFRIRLLDKYGSIIYLNKSDFSFTIEFDQVYSY
uniref:Uncharacterized protein n=1 Tax=viral metagenome TaxID=1070528 RepID=A0A6C0CLL9_9ZZZZ